MSKSKYKYGSDDDEDDTYEQPDNASDGSSDDESEKKPKKKGSGKKKLSSDKKAAVKGSVSGSVSKELKNLLDVNPNLYSTVAQDLSPYEIIEAAVYTLFNDPADAPKGVGQHGYKGCQQVTITLGPKQELGQVGTNSTGTYPLAIKKAGTTYPTETFVSGHVLNADFGGPDAAKNMTILTSSANGQQKTFDSNVKKARNALYNVYMDLALLDPISATFLKDLEYGIELDIQVGAAGGEWDVVYPGNCISDQVDLVATVVNEADVTNALANPGANFNNAHKMTIINGLANKLTIVQNHIATANTGSPLNNT